MYNKAVQRLLYRAIEQSVGCLTAAWLLLVDCLTTEIQAYGNSHKNTIKQTGSEGCKKVFFTYYDITTLAMVTWTIKMNDLSSNNQLYFVVHLMTLMRGE